MLRVEGHVPARSRVMPFGDCVLTHARTTTPRLLRGGRGCVRDARVWDRPSYRLPARYHHLPEFKNRDRAVVSPDSCTERVLLDEATARLAGNLPRGMSPGEVHEVQPLSCRGVSVHRENNRKCTCTVQSRAVPVD